MRCQTWESGAAITADSETVVEVGGEVVIFGSGGCGVWGVGWVCRGDRLGSGKKELGMERLRNEMLNCVFVEETSMGS